MTYPQEVATSCEMALVQFQQDLNDMTRSQKGEVNFISVVSSLALQKHGIEDFNLFLI